MRLQKRAFTILEVLIAISVILLGFFAIIRLISAGYGYTVSGNQRAKASRLLQELIEELSFVPFGEYSKAYGDNLGGDWIEVMDQFFPRTRKSIDSFKAANEKSWKEFGFEALLKARKNELDQIVLLSFSATIKWREEGELSNQSSNLREVTAGTIVANPEAVLGVKKP